MSANFETLKAEKLEAAMQIHRAGDFAQAAQLYTALTQEYPSWPDPWNLLGMAYHSLGKLQDALIAANQAIGLAKHPKFLSDRATIFLALGNADLALADAQAAIKLDSNLADPCVNALSAMRALGQHAKAIRMAKSYLERHPQNADIWNNLGAFLLDQQQMEEATQAFGKACELNELHLAAHENMARIAWHQGRTAEAVDATVKAFDLGTADTEVLGPWLAQLETQTFDAPGEAQTKRDTQLREGWYRLLDKGSAAQLIKLLDGTDRRNGMFQASSLFQRMGLKEQSLRMLTRARDLMPNDADIVNNMGVSYFAQEDYRNALDSFKRGVELRNDFSMGWRNVGVCHFMLIEPEEARLAFEKAFQLDPNSVSTCLYHFGQSLQCCEWSQYEEVKRMVLDLGMAEAKPDDLTASLAFLAAVETASDMRIIAPRVAETISGRVDTTLVLERIPFKRRERLRIGYFSYDFRTHPVGYLTEEIYALHDRSKFETYALSYGPDDGSVFRKAVEQHVEHFVELRNLMPTDMVRRIRDLDLDIVMDLSGNTQGARPDVMMHRVAPIQCHWLGYVWSMGHPAYDYIMGDLFSIPPEVEHGYVEKIARLPHTLQVASRKLAAADVLMTRQSQGLPEDAFVMCNFGSFSKLQPHLFKAWLRILKAIPHAVLWMARTHRSPPEAFERLRLLAREQGVRDEQIIFSEPMGREEHLLRYKLADLALDTFPQGSGTTAIEALWMGCPMVSMAGAGDTLAIRMAGGILNAVGLSELIANSQDEYEALVLALGKDRDRVATLRQHLETQKLSLPLFDTPRKIQYLEQAFERMAHNAETSGDPVSFTIEA